MGEMRADTLSARHPCCDPALFARYDALYRGGPAFRAMLTEFLPRNPMEPESIYDLRKKSAWYRGYVGAIIDFFAAQLFASSFQIRTSIGGEPAEPDDFYSQFQEDVDLAGTDLVTFLKARFVTAMVKGVSWILAEVPDDEDVAPEARADWDARGLGRVRLRALEAEDVLDWETDEYGQLRWAITHSRQKRRDNPREARVEVTETWRIYDAVDVETFQVVYDPTKQQIKPEDEIPSLGRRPHRFPRVPLVQLRLPEGLWLLNRAADAQVELFRLSVGASWAMARCCYPMPVFKTADPNNPPTPVTGAGYVQVIGINEAFEWAAPASAPFEVLQAAQANQKDELYRITQQMASSANNNATALNRSGESKEADSAATEICLHAYGLHTKATAEDIFELVSDGRGDVDRKFSVEGMNKFSTGDIAASLANMKAALDLGLPSPTLVAELGVKAADMLLPDAAQPVKDKIRAEFSEAATAKKEAPAPPTEAPPGGAPAPAPEGARPPPPAAAA